MTEQQVTEQVWALVDEHDVVDRVILADQAFIDTLPAQIADPGVDTGELVAHGAYDVTDDEVRPAAGWRRLHGAWTPPTTLTADVEHVVEAYPAQFTFTDHRPVVEPVQIMRVAGVDIGRVPVDGDGTATFTLGRSEMPSRPADLDPDAQWLVVVEVGGAETVVNVTA